MTNRNAVAFEKPDLTYGNAPPGAYSFLNLDGRKIGIEHACPCGCGGLTALWFADEKHPEGSPVWTVTGQWPKVTLSPSIGVKYDGKGNGPFTSPYHWHGYLRNGVFEEC